MTVTWPCAVIGTKSHPNGNFEHRPDAQTRPAQTLPYAMRKLAPRKLFPTQRANSPAQTRPAQTFPYAKRKLPRANLPRANFPLRKAQTPPRKLFAQTSWGSRGEGAGPMQGHVPGQRGLAGHADVPGTASRWASPRGM